MKIGITYDLRDDYLSMGYNPEQTAEFDCLETIDAIDDTLGKMGFITDRIGNVRHLLKRLAAGDRWDLVFNIAEGMHGFGRESAVPALLDAYRIPYTFSDPLVLAITLHKGITKHLLKCFGIPTADFEIVESPDDIHGISLSFPLFVKPVAEGTSKGINADSKITSPETLERICRKLLTEYEQPVLVETFLPGREFTVGITGTGRDAMAVGIMEVVLLSKAEQEVYSYANKQLWRDRVVYRPVEETLAREAKILALRIWRKLGCRDAGRVDLREDAQDHLNCIEINPLAGLNPNHSDLPILADMAGISFFELLTMIIRSALKRTGKPALPVAQQRI
ncbi:D-alanine--D-alanine ligase [bacterium]|nr:D-alanine--D-alanine ligase [candidate division CSSED10-310 bacterium]